MPRYSPDALKRLNAVLVALAMGLIGFAAGIGNERQRWQEHLKKSPAECKALVDKQ